jgi:hypothetical protein
MLIALVVFKISILVIPQISKSIVSNVFAEQRSEGLKSLLMVCIELFSMIYF